MICDHNDHYVIIRDVTAVVLAAAGSKNDRGRLQLAGLHSGSTR